MGPYTLYKTHKVVTCYIFLQPCEGVGKGSFHYIHSQGLKKSLCEGVPFSNSFLSLGQRITKRKFKKMHTSIPVKNKNEFIKIHYIYHTEVKKQIHKLICFSLEHSR